MDHVGLSGIGKTLSSTVISAMFGNPDKLQLSPDSTQLGISKIAEYSTDLPMFIDDTTRATNHVKKFVYMLANGNSRVKSSSADELNISNNYTTVLICTGESPLLTSDARAGEDSRVVPLNEGVKENLSQKTIADIELAVKQNYGQIAVLFIKEVIDNKENIHAIYSAFLDELPKVDDRSSLRVQKYYAAIATAGYFLEKSIL